jgi:hypothetical protein
MGGSHPLISLPGPSTVNGRRRLWREKRDIAGVCFGCTVAAFSDVASFSRLREKVRQGMRGNP